MLSSSEPRRRKKESGSPKSKEKERDKDKEKDREHRKSKSRPHVRKTRSSTSKDDDENDDEEKPRKHSSRERMRTASSSTPRSQKMSVVPEMERRGSVGTASSLNGSRTSLPYPSFAKTYSKENIYSRPEPIERKKSPFTPEPTDLGLEQDEKDKARAPQAPTREPPSPPPARAPPSPPLTATTAADLRKTASANSMRRKNLDEVKEMEGGRRSVESGTRVTSKLKTTASRSSVREGEADGTDLTSTTSSAPSTVRGKTPKVAPVRVHSASPARSPKKAPSTTLRAVSDVTQSTDSDATSVPPEYQPSRRTGTSPSSSDVSRDSVADSSPRTPTQHSVLPSVTKPYNGPRPPTVEIVMDPGSRSQSVDSTYTAPLTPPPPPPPPTMMEAPRVDYLLQNGGLNRPVPRTLLAALEGTPVAAYNQYTSPRVAGPQVHDARTFFKPMQRLLDDYNAVIDTNGSLAVATGYRSVARRLLDRLEAVFARNISSECCECIMCFGQHIQEDHAGVNWGEILELVSGRCDLPSWPPLEPSSANGLGIADLEDPCQRIDVDVPEKFREHYLQQSRKTKASVQSWLSNQQETVPEDADDETLTFAMLTRLEQAQRPLFYALLYGMEEIPTPRSRPDTKATPPYLTKAALAIQRLYRLYSPPRSQLVVMYLIRHPDMHNTLATLSAVTKHEWEILVSGRFDGFLWSGAETIPSINSPGPSRGPSGDVPTLNGPQRFASPGLSTPYAPFSPGPGQNSRPGSVRPGSVAGRAGPAPVQIDEETEVAVLAEVEREIFLGMEAMEDAFEQLHVAAENVRRRLRERGAALSMVAQQRRGPGGDIEVRMNTPAGVMGDGDEGSVLGEVRSEIGPDDSASNVGMNRKRRGHRARERRTPAPVEEGDETGGSSLAERVRRKY
jgi:hypothetical protein